MEEIWKDIPNYEGLYQVSNIGRIKSLERVALFGTQKRTISQIIRKLKKKKEGYLFVQLSNKSKQSSFYIHRLVATSFCDGYFEGADINHKDGDKENNRVTNLEWCTRKHNINHAFNILHKNHGGCKVGKAYNQLAIVQLSLQGEKINEWKSAYEVQRILGFNESSIRQCLKGYDYKGRRRIQSYGYKWVYAEKYYQDQIKQMRENV